MKRFRRALVTGASSGLGRQVCLELASRGTAIVACARRAELLGGLVEELVAAGGDAVALPLDVTRPESVQGAIDAAPPFDLVVAAAGVAEHSVPDDDRGARARRVLDVNLLGAITTVEAAAASMAAGGGTIAVISSLAGVRGVPGAAAYSASKAALSTYLEARAIELSGRAIDLVDVRPGFVRTPMTEPNDFPMPFLMGVEAAARRTVDGISAGGAVVTYPRRLAWPLQLVAALAPRWLWRRMLRRDRGELA